MTASVLLVPAVTPVPEVSVIVFAPTELTVAPAGMPGPMTAMPGRMTDESVAPLDVVTLVIVALLVVVVPVTVAPVVKRPVTSRIGCCFAAPGEKVRTCTSGVPVLSTCQVACGTS